MLAPENYALDVVTSPTFIWSPATSENISYSLRIWKDSLKKDLLLSVPDIMDTSFTIPIVLQNAGTYFWSVVAANPDGEELEANQMFRFTTLYNNPAPSPDITNYYVGKEGIDQPWAGSEELPFKTVAYASRMVPQNEGDNINIGEGEFIETQPIRLGLKTNLIGAGKEKTVLKSGGVVLSPGTNPNAGNYKESFEGSLVQLISEKLIPGQGAIAPADGSQAVTGFTIDGMSGKLKAGIWVENRKNVELHDLVIKDCDYRGAVVSTGNVSGTKSFFLTGIKVHDCLFQNSGKDLESETLGNLCLSSLDGAEIYNIKIEDQEGYGIKFIYRGYFTNCKFHDITTTLNENDEKWGEKIAIELWNLGPGNEIYNIEANTWISLVNDADVYGEMQSDLNAKVHGVRIIDIDGNSNSRGFELAVPHVELSDVYIENKGIGIAIWDMGRENITIRNTILRNSKYQQSWAQGPGLYVDNSRSWNFTKIRVFNSVFDTQNFAIIIKGAVSDMEIKNTLILQAGSADVVNQANATLLFHNNFKSHDQTIGWVLEGNIDGLGNLAGDPLINANGAFYETYYMPLSGSPLIDAGTDVGLPFIGNAPDIGFAEVE